MFKHETVLLEESVDMLAVRPGGVYVDCTLGGGGHSALILERLHGRGRLLGLDQDERAIANAAERFSGQDNFDAIRCNFRDIPEVLRARGIECADGFLFDLGVSSPQLDEAERGFSYHQDAPLDMRMDRRQTLDAAQIVNQESAEELERIIFCYGEERWARRIAQFIVEARREKPVESTEELVQIIKRAIPKKVRQQGGHPARKTFQALRIAVNDELGALEDALQAATDCLCPQGRIAVITFHSLEDRIVKELFKAQSRGCTCPPDFPICVCGQVPRIKRITRKPMEPRGEETVRNRRARSAKLRVAERIVHHEKEKG